MPRQGRGEVNRNRLNMWNVYVLKSLKDSGYYIGCTSDLSKRLKEHNCGYNISTKNRRPFKLVFYEKHEGQKEAFAREAEIKSYKGGRAFKKLIGVI